VSLNFVMYVCVCVCCVFCNMWLCVGLDILMCACVQVVGFVLYESCVV